MLATGRVMEGREDDLVPCGKTTEETKSRNILLDKM